MLIPRKLHFLRLKWPTIFVLCLFRMTRGAGITLAILESARIVAPSLSSIRRMLDEPALRICLSFISAFYFWKLTGGKSLFIPASLGALPDALGRNLMEGRVDLGQQFTGIESWIYGGKNHTYFGIFPTLLRLI